MRQLARDLQRKGYAGRTVGIKLRFDDFKTVTRDLTLPEPTAEADAIRRAGGPVPEARRFFTPPAPAGGAHGFTAARRSMTLPLP